ncbi:hypothetical protein Tco_0015993 [Tanacetum coccineum]
MTSKSNNSELTMVLNSGIAFLKNSTLIEAARTMLSRSIFSKQYWTEAVATAFYIRSHKDHLGKFDEKADDVLNNNHIAENERYPPDEYLHPYEPSQSQNGQTDQNDQTAQTDEILNDNLSEHSNHNNDEQIIDNLPNTNDIQISEHSSSPNVEDTLIKHSERGISIYQEKYVKDLLKKYDINGSSVKTPMVPPNNLGPDLSGKAVNETQYRANPKESHLIAVKRIFRKSTSAAARCCGSILLMKSQPTHYDIIYEKVRIYQKLQENRQKTGKHGHEKRKSSIEAKDAKPKPEKVNLQSNWSNLGQQKVNYVKSRALIDHLSIKATWLWKKAQGEVGFTLGSLREVAQAVTSRMTAWQSLSVHT